MWTVKGFDRDRGEIEVPFIEIADGRSRKSIAAAVHQMKGALPRAFERELSAEDPLPGIDGIETWGRRAAELVGPPELGSGLVFEPVGYVENGEEVLGLSWTDGIQLASRAFHSHDALVVDISGLNEIEISSATARMDEPRYPFTQSGMFFEWRAYLGEGTLVSEGETPFEAIAGKGQSTRLRLLGCVGILIGRAVGWMGRDHEPSRDPFSYPRLKHFEQKHVDVRKRYPNLAIFNHGEALFREIYDPPPSGPVAVFLHGTFSCALPNLALLHPLPIPTYRFEHDTFQSISCNARELVQAIKGYLQPRRIHLLAHSRGGLVARLAARELVKLGFKPVVRTYGTPHLGTPLANAGGRAFEFLLSMGRTAAAGIFSWDPVSLAGKVLMKSLIWSKKLPEGLRVMRTDEETLKSWQFGSEPFPLLSYGGEYDRRALANGACAYALGEIVAGAFRGQDNDLVVPTSSALAAGKGEPVLSPCTHFEYFSNDCIRAEIQRLD